MNTQVGALREVLPQQSVCVLVRGSLTWTGRVAEVDRQARGLGYRVMLGHLGSAIPGEGATHRARYLRHRFHDAGGDGASCLVVGDMH